MELSPDTAVAELQVPHHLVLVGAVEGLGQEGGAWGGIVETAKMMSCSLLSESARKWDRSSLNLSTKLTIIDSDLKRKSNHLCT